MPPRLSVDLDFNYIGAADRAGMLNARPDIVEALESGLGTAARLQVDINFLFRTPLLPVQSHPVWNPLDEAPFETSVVGMGELMAGKMLALIDRSAPRDLFEPMVSRWLSLEEHEREYTARLQHGDLQPALLFPEDEQMATILRHHPVLPWNAQNAAEHSKRDS